MNIKKILFIKEFYFKNIFIILYYIFILIRFIYIYIIYKGKIY